MQIYLIRDGERSGPFWPFQLKGKVERGEVGADTLVWTEGMDGWKRLDEVESLVWLLPEGTRDPAATIEEDGDGGGEGGEVAAGSPRDGDAAGGEAAGEVAGAGAVALRPWVRFWARMVDWNLMSFVVMLMGMAFGAGGEGVVVPGYGFLVAVAVAWALIESVMLSQWGTTPGKLLLGVRVETAGEGKAGGGVPPLGAAVKRSLLMVFFGFGLALPLLMPLAWAVSYMRLRAVGRTLWDEYSGLRVVTKTVSVARVWVVVVVLLLLTALSVVWQWDELMKLYGEMQAEASEGGGA